MNSDDIYFVYSGLHESEIFWVGQVRFFDEMGGQFDIKPLYYYMHKHTINLACQYLVDLANHVGK